MLNLSDLENQGLTVKKFCGLDIQENVGCTGEAVGDIVAEMEDGMQIPIPVCQQHLDVIQSHFDVESLG
ncbi:hypothetical protein SEA_EMMA1919_114 [Streptomyces phage Emma1919]|uniref:Uncharacterized protein n=2 Tax=Gilsonvirus gilson TaxID=2846398 RepID=A0A3T0ICQ2_9CAUD|nr:hypothetical protein HWB98_gp146 [Streptomyces phage Gilson]QQV92474.1 hypothetical protein SEA_MEGANTHEEKILLA_113 [Streptomyces phage MeganTheeKilla]QZE11247.1 hypothetical protein SEA_FORREST_118 [Streptomyces phage Forrest]QZE11472.1 hypothetical protein SEA_JADA_114 [Streptomyces phage Jada]URQ04719.1 hypothetical protein SEA_EMMA1919_114 [Streptomyces phage Emma1919]AZU97183.1 hypothetical protein SEA_GILSON_113 [Streptomyces phage Gilson]